MKISFLLGHELPFPPTAGGGVNSLLNSLTIALARAGHEVTAYSPNYQGSGSNEILNGVHHIRIEGATRHPNNLVNQVKGLPYVLRARSVLAPCDVLNCHLLGSFLMKPHRNARVVTHTIHRDPKRFLNLMRHLDRIYTGSDAVSDEAAKVAPVLANKIRTIYNCVDFMGYPPDPRPRNELFTFIFVGRFTRDKGLASLFQGFIQLAQKRVDVRLVTIGPLDAQMGAEPEFLKQMREFAANSGVGDRIEIKPPIFQRAKLDEEIQRADVVCLPSLGGETLNMGLLESLRLARPSLVSDLPANKPLVEPGVSGFTVRADDSADWANAMDRMVSISPSEYLRFADGAYSHGFRRFSSDAIAELYVADYDELLRG